MKRRVSPALGSSFVLLVRGSLLYFRCLDSQARTCLRRQLLLSSAINTVPHIPLLVARDLKFRTAVTNDDYHLVREAHYAKNAQSNTSPIGDAIQCGDYPVLTLSTVIKSDNAKGKIQKNTAPTYSFNS